MVNEPYQEDVENEHHQTNSVYLVVLPTIIL